MLEDRLMNRLTARYCREPQAFDLGVESRQAVGLVLNEALIAFFQGLVAQLHDVELGQIREVHLQEVVLLEILEFEAGAQEFDDPPSLVTKTWQLIDEMRGSSSRGVFISVCVYRQISASHQQNLPPNTL